MLLSVEIPPKKNWLPFNDPPPQVISLKSLRTKRLSPQEELSSKSILGSKTWKMSKILNKTNWGPIMGPNLFGDVFSIFGGECFLHFLIGPMENWCHLGFCWVELPSLLNEPVQKTHGFQMYLFFPPLLAISKVSISTPFPSRLQQQIKTPGLGRSRPMVRKIHKDLGATKFEVFTN